MIWAAFDFLRTSEERLKAAIHLFLNDKPDSYLLVWRNRTGRFYCVLGVFELKVLNDFMNNFENELKTEYITGNICTHQFIFLLRKFRKQLTLKRGVRVTNYRNVQSKTSDRSCYGVCKVKPSPKRVLQDCFKNKLKSA